MDDAPGDCVSKPDNARTSKKKLVDTVTAARSAGRAVRARVAGWRASFEPIRAGRLARCQRYDAHGVLWLHQGFRLPVQLNVVPVPEEAKPAVHTHVVAPSWLILPFGQAVHDVVPATAL